MSRVPIIQFDGTRALRYLPKKVLRHVRTVEKAANEETVIVSKVTALEAFVGSYVEIIDPETGDVLYG